MIAKANAPERAGRGRYLFQPPASDTSVGNADMINLWSN